MYLKKVQKQGRDEKNAIRLPYICYVFFSRYRIVFLCSSIFALFLYLLQLHPYLKWCFAETFSLVIVGRSPNYVWNTFPRALIAVCIVCVFACFFACAIPCFFSFVGDSVSVQVLSQGNETKHGCLYILLFQVVPQAVTFVSSSAEFDRCIHHVEFLYSNYVFKMW